MLKDKDKQRVLIVDDSELMRQMLGSYVRELGFREIYSAKDGRRAVSLFTNHPADITFLDIDMPKLNGIETLKKIREIDNSAYVVMVSGESTIENLQQAISAGAQGFIVKPYSPQKLVEAIDKYEQSKSAVP